MVCTCGMLRMGGNRWRGGGKRGTSEMRWEREVKIVMKQNNLTPQDAVNRKYMAERVAVPGVLVGNMDG